MAQQVDPTIFACCSHCVHEWQQPILTITALPISCPHCGRLGKLELCLHVTYDDDEE